MGGRKRIDGAERERRLAYLNDKTGNCITRLRDHGIDARTAGKWRTWWSATQKREALEKEQG